MHERRGDKLYFGTTVYFDNPGPKNTNEVLKLAKKRAEELNIRDIVVASTTGITGVKASKIFKGFNVIIVSHFTGFREHEMQELTAENRKKIEGNGGKILTSTHAFMGIERGIRNKFNTAYPTEIIAETLRLFGEGTKVAVEIVVIATDAGLTGYNGDVIAIGGTGRGADTALIVKPSNSTRFFDLTVKEVIAKVAKRNKP